MSDKILGQCVKLIRSSLLCGNAEEFLRKAGELAKQLEPEFSAERKIVSCPWCEGTGDVNKNRCEQHWDACPECNGSGERPWIPIKDTGEMVREIHELMGQRLKRVQVREEKFVEAGGHNAYQVVIETVDGDVYSINGDHERGPNITKLDDVPPVKIERDW